MMYSVVVRPDCSLDSQTWVWRAMGICAHYGTYWFPKGVWCACIRRKKCNKATNEIMHSIKHNRLEAAVLFAIQYQVSTAVSYSEIVARINAAPLKKSQSHRLNDQITAKEKELTKITRYKQPLYQDWKDGEISQ